jgi:tetratricopeptide (TPR) repeat protein/serine/threonine protein kinase
MLVKVLCGNPNCDASYSVTSEEAGQWSACPKCGWALTVEAELSEHGVELEESQEVADRIGGWEESSEPVVPNPFGRYRIVRKLGKGGMAAVYLAQDMNLDRLVALKIPSKEIHASADGRRRFAREARAAAALEHANICPVYDIGQIDGLLYLAMPFIDGEPLSAMIQRGPLDGPRAADLIRTLAVAMVEAHGRGVIHRDLKPSNVLMCPRRGLVITDFGIARCSEAIDGQLTRTGVLLGTPSHMAPEQVMGDHRATGPWTDVYALGVMLYELLTCRRPFRGNAAWVLAQVLHDAPEAPSLLVPGVSPRLESICLRALAKATADRHATMAEFVADLEGYLEEERRVVPATEVSLAPDVSRLPEPEVRLAAEPSTLLDLGRLSATSLAPEPPSVPEPDSAAEPRSTGGDGLRGMARDGHAAPRMSRGGRAGRATRRGAMLRARSGKWAASGGQTFRMLAAAIAIALTGLMLIASRVDWNATVPPAEIVTATMTRVPEPSDVAVHSLQTRPASPSRTESSGSALPTVKSEPQPKPKVAPEVARPVVVVGRSIESIASAGNRRGAVGSPAAVNSERKSNEKESPSATVTPVSPALTKTPVQTGESVGVQRLERAPEVGGKPAGPTSDRARFTKPVAGAGALSSDLVAKGSRIEGARSGISQGVTARKRTREETIAFAMRYADALMEARQYTEAIAKYSVIIKLDPNQVRAYRKRGAARERIGDEDAALSDYTEAIRLGPETASARVTRGRLLISINAYNEALEDYNRAIQLDSQLGEAYSGRGSVWICKGEYGRAVGDLTRAIGLNPKDVAAYNNRGLAWSRKGDFDRAIKDYTDSLTLDRKSATTFSNRGRAWDAKKDYDRAIADCNTALELDPRHSMAYNNRGFALAHRGDLDSAIANYSAAIQFDPDNITAYINRSSAWLRERHYDRSIADYSEWIRLDSTDAWAFYGRGVAHGSKADYDGAIRDYSEAIRLDSKHVKAHIDRGLAWSMKGDFARAVADTTAAIALSPKYSVPYATRGLIFVEKGDYNQAIEDLTYAISLDSNAGSYYAYRGRAWQKLGQYPFAVNDYAAALKLNPGDTLARNGWDAILQAQEQAAAAAPPATSGTEEADTGIFKWTRRLMEGGLSGVATGAQSDLRETIERAQNNEVIQRGRELLRDLRDQFGFPGSDN